MDEQQWFSQTDASLEEVDDCRWSRQTTPSLEAVDDHGHPQSDASLEEVDYDRWSHQTDASLKEVGDRGHPQKDASLKESDIRSRSQTDASLKELDDQGHPQSDALLEEVDVRRQSRQTNASLEEEEGRSHPQTDASQEEVDVRIAEVRHKIEEEMRDSSRERSVFRIERCRSTSGVEDHYERSEEPPRFRYPRPEIPYSASHSSARVNNILIDPAARTVLDVNSLPWHQRYPLFHPHLHHLQYRPRRGRGYFRLPPLVRYIPGGQNEFPRCNPMTQHDFSSELMAYVRMRKEMLKMDLREKLRKRSQALVYKQAAVKARMQYVPGGTVRRPAPKKERAAKEEAKRETRRKSTPPVQSSRTREKRPKRNSDSSSSSDDNSNADDKSDKYDLSGVRARRSPSVEPNLENVDDLFTTSAKANHLYATSVKVGSKKWEGKENEITTKRQRSSCVPKAYLRKRSRSPETKWGPPSSKKGDHRLQMRDSNQVRSGR